MLVMNVCKLSVSDAKRDCRAAVLTFHARLMKEEEGMTTNYLRVEWLFSVVGSKECDLNFSALSILKRQGGLAKPSQPFGSEKAAELGTDCEFA